MSKNPTPSFSESMSKAARPRSSGDLREMFGRSYLPSSVVPLADATYEIPLDRIASDPDQPRKSFDHQELQDLSNSIRENGVLQPITVYENPANPDSYMIVTGERRYRAAKLAGLTSVPCILRASEFDRSRIDQEQLVENIQRADLAPIEAARALSEFMKRHQYSQREAAKKLGKPLMFLNELVSILRIPNDLLDQAGVAALPKQVLVELSRATPSEQPQLLEQALRGAPRHQVQQQRSNRKNAMALVYYHEIFPVEGHPSIELRWKKHPAEVTTDDLVEVLGHVLRQLVDRTARH